MTRDELLDRLAMELGEWVTPGEIIPMTATEIERRVKHSGYCWEVINTAGGGVAVARCACGVVSQGEWEYRRTQLINKPSWEEVEAALPGADWMAQDANGWWHAYRCDKSPRAFNTCFVSSNYSPGTSIGVVKGAIPSGHDWRDTLERRPEDSYNEDRIDVVGQNGATGEHYDEAQDAVNALLALREAVREASPIASEEPVKPDPVNHPEHYQSDNGIECIDAIRASLGLEGFVAYCRGNAMKYAFRSGRKQNHAEDLRKGAWYLDRAAKSLDAESDND